MIGRKGRRVRRGCAIIALRQRIGDADILPVNTVLRPRYIGGRVRAGDTPSAEQRAVLVIDEVRLPLKRHARRVRRVNRTALGGEGFHRHGPILEIIADGEVVELSRS